MAMNPRARRGRPHAPKNWSGTRPSPASTDPRRRRSGPGKPRPDRPTISRPVEASNSSPLAEVLDDFTRSWERGECPRAERYLALLPAEESVDLIYHEYCLAEGSNLDPDPDEYLRRFPDHADRLSRIFALHGALPSSALRDWASPVDLPVTGDDIGPYHLLRELGRGAFARVFLAEQGDLDHRLVVLKVSSRSTAEPRLLARARHPHIVEVLRHDSTDDGALHLVCMPFLGGATLASVLEVRRGTGRKPRSGRDFLKDLDRVSAPEYQGSELARPAREILDRLSYPAGLAWIVARLAQALDHAYSRGVAHGDLKPSNVLMTAEGMPLLLDMNLSSDWRSSEFDDDGGPAGDLGGTLAYMAPERLQVIARRGEEPGSKPIDRHRADLYGLGLVLLEALTGRSPEVRRTRDGNPPILAARLAEARRDLPSLGDRAIPTALRSILARCLAPDPLDRYARGNELAEDLDRWRSARPLTFADEPRRSTLARSIRQSRFPLVAGVSILAVALAAGWILSVVLTGSKRKDGLSKYSMIVDRADSGVFTFRQIGQWRDDDLSDPAEASARQLARYDVMNDPNWRDRDDVRSLPDRDREELEAWLMEQVLRHAVSLRERIDSPEDWQRGLGLLDRTLARGWSSALHLERATLLHQLGRNDAGGPAAEAPRVPEWLSEYLAGVAAEPIHAREALDHYRETLRVRPEMFWAHYRAAALAVRLGEYEFAINQLRHCVARSPENPALRLKLASILCYAEHQAPRPLNALPFAQALVECDRAVRLDPNYAMAYWIRAWIRKTAGQSDGVRRDILRHASLTRRSGPSVNLAIGFDLRFPVATNYCQSPDAYHSLARKMLDDSSGDQKTRMTLGWMLALEKRPKEAIAEYDRVIDANPGHLLARYNRALQIGKLDPKRSIAEYQALIEEPRFEELLIEDPSSFRVFHYLATDLLDRGQLDEALDVANRSLVHINRVRSLSHDVLLARQNSPNQPKIFPQEETYYLRARIHAKAARLDPGQIEPVVKNLQQAFAKNSLFREKWFAKDSLFDDLRSEILTRLEIGPRVLDR